MFESYVGLERMFESYGMPHKFVHTRIYTGTRKYTFRKSRAESA